LHLGAAYEGPPGHVHGGVAALVLDHLPGEAAADPESPRLTGTISFRYVLRHPTGPAARRGGDHASRRSQDVRDGSSCRRAGRHGRSRGRVHPAPVGPGPLNLRLGAGAAVAAGGRFWPWRR
jgi:hypothetical protein